MAGLILWPIALLIVFVRAAGLIAAEKARQTLDVLLTTPLSLSELLGAKMRGLRRMDGDPRCSDRLSNPADRLSSPGGRATALRRMESRQILPNAGEAVFYVFLIGLNLVILFGLAAQLAFLFGLYARTQGRAVTAVWRVCRGVLSARGRPVRLPTTIGLGICSISARSPTSSTSEFPRLGVEWGRSRRSIRWASGSLTGPFIRSCTARFTR